MKISFFKPMSRFCTGLSVFALSGIVANAILINNGSGEYSHIQWQTLASTAAPVEHELPYRSEEYTRGQVDEKSVSVDHIETASIDAEVNGAGIHLESSVSSLIKRQ